MSYGLILLYRYPTSCYAYTGVLPGRDMTNVVWVHFSLDIDTTSVVQLWQGKEQWQEAARQEIREVAKVNRPELSTAELEVMKVLWDKGTGTVKDVQEALPDKNWGYTTFMTLVVRAYEKGYLKREKQGPAYIYEPVVSKKKTMGKMVRGFVDRVFDGALGPLVNYIAESKELSPKEMEELRKLAKSLERGGKK